MGGSTLPGGMCSALQCVMQVRDALLLGFMQKAVLFVVV